MTRTGHQALSMRECERPSGGDTQRQEVRPESYCEADEPKGKANDAKITPCSNKGYPARHVGPIA